MDATVIGIALFLIIVLLGVILFLQYRKPPGTIGDVSTTLQTLTQIVQQGQTQIATLTEKIAHIEQNQVLANQGIGSLATGLAQTGTVITSRMSDAQQQSLTSVHQVGTNLASELTKFQQQSLTSVHQVGKGLASEIAKLQQESGAALAELRTLATGLNETTASIRTELARAKDDLTDLQASAKARQALEIRTAESVKRLETIIAGTQSKGSAGENILELVFAKLPIEWQVRNFQIGGKSVEFGLRLPNNLILPIDSKWAATNLLEQFAATSDVDEQQRLKASIGDAVLKKAKEVKKYIDPSVTVAFGVAVIPDAIYDLCNGVQAEAFQMNVVLVSYSMFIPYLLLVFQTMLKTSQTVDLQKLDAHLQTVQNSIKALQDELDGRFSRSITMLNNSRDDMRAHISKVSSSLTSLQLSVSTPTMLPTPNES